MTMGLYIVCFTLTSSLRSIRRSSNYLKTSRGFLLNSLRGQINHSLKRKKEQLFVVSRLKLLDQRFCLSLNHDLWKSYLDIGSQEEVWAVSNDHPNMKGTFL